MCGITGFIDLRNKSSVEILQKMISTLKHRGSDDSGNRFFQYDDFQVGIAQNRLSIIDLTAGGHQPMYFKNYAIVFNGEIYNYVEIKYELSQLGHQFVSGSDTEVVLHAFDQWGAEAVHRFIGMFAFVIFDSVKLEINIFRDRAGVKPLFYYWKNGLFLFASELKALCQHPSFVKDIDEKSLTNYFDSGFIPAPYSIYSDTYKLEPGHRLVIDPAKKTLSRFPYWDVRAFYSKPKLRISYSDAKAELHELLKSAFQYRMVADVPVGVFLSGGYDSTAVTAILQCNNSERLKTFTIGFEQGNNESHDARRAAEFLNTDHHELVCTTKEAQYIIPELPYFYDEPFADSSAIPTILVSRFAKEHVKVALSADAGDEIFAGYNTYKSLQSKEKLLGLIPRSFRKGLSPLLETAYSKIPESNAAIKHKVYGVAKALNRDVIKQSADIFRIMAELPVFYKTGLFKNGVTRHETPYDYEETVISNGIDWAMCADYRSYLTDDILAKVDRATMSTSLEGREPFLDHRIIEFAARLPIKFKFDGRVQKKILKEIVHEYIPASMMDRPKTGFSLPISSWLRKDLSYLIEEHLDERSLRLSDLFNVERVSSLVRDFKSNRLHHTTIIWRLLMFQMWYKKWMR